MAEVIYDTLPKRSQGFSLNFAGKGHPISNRVFETYEDIYNYVNDQYSSAVSGIILVSLKDWTDTNGKLYPKGAYLVQQVKGDKPSETIGTYTTHKLIQLVTGDAQTITIAADTPPEVGKIWFDSTNKVIKVCTAAPEGAEATWEQYALTQEEITALILAAKNEVLGALEEGDSNTLKALNDEIDALQDQLADIGATAGSQTITSAGETLQVSRTGNDVNVELVWTLF